jgi:hypothetical protein
MSTNTSNYITFYQYLHKLAGEYGKERAYIAQKILSHPKITPTHITLGEVAGFFATSKAALSALIKRYPYQTTRVESKSNEDNPQ